ncbi:MAG TPA: phenylalanine--tRNA ligase subunit beta, partial [Caldithrix abyssi]|nr:phenylalanine--tRNA ligase subunit beta [Caldithrix abyssi]
MKVTYRWLKDYVDFSESAFEIADKLTHAGFEVEEIHPMIQPFTGVVVGEVVEVEKHPNADKLSVCKVRTAEGEYQVICGAPNVAQGQFVPFAQVGAVLPGGFKIKKAKIRGVESFGMICSKEELGLEKQSDGIWAFEQPMPLGEDVHALLSKEEDYLLDFFITPNRPDCLSVVGIAREIAALTGSTLRLPQVQVQEQSTEKIDDLVSIKIHDPEGCPRYAARIIRGVKLAPSPEWMQHRLEAVGVRPINNIVDITNYVLMELGHPLHAFDLAQIKGPEINVRSSEPGEKFTTLDEKERELPANTVMICDRDRAVAIGGIMGGLNSEVSDTTKDILLESAYFNPERIAFSSKKLGLSTEASQRFERGADPNGVLRALDRAAQLMAELAGGTIVTGVYDVYPRPIKPQ